MSPKLRNTYTHSLLSSIWLAVSSKGKRQCRAAEHHHHLSVLTAAQLSWRSITARSYIYTSLPNSNLFVSEEPLIKQTAGKLYGKGRSCGRSLPAANCTSFLFAPACISLHWTQAILHLALSFAAAFHMHTHIAKLQELRLPAICIRCVRYRSAAAESKVTLSRRAACRWMMDSLTALSCRSGTSSQSNNAFTLRRNSHRRARTLGTAASAHSQRGLACLPPPLPIDLDVHETRCEPSLSE